MTKREFEPGPWILGGASGRMITTPSGYAGDGFIADVDTLANARLISCAPEMFEMLKEARSALDEFEYNQEFVTKIDHLLKKAIQP
jgi:hypothetical protein